jgi:seryl-tRNA synthetase
MLSRQFIREHPDEVREAARKKRVDLPLDRLLALDARVEDLKRELQARREEGNRVSRSTANAAREDKAALVELGRVLRAEIKVLEDDLRALEAELHDLLLRVPNIPDPSVPEGADDSANVPVKYWGEPPRFAVPPRDHVALMERLGMLDVERGAKVAGSRSYILKGPGALLEMALTQLAMDRLVGKGFTPLIVPALVREFCLVGSGQFPSGREQTYELPADGVFLSGTAEVAMIGMHAEEILPLDALPIRYVALSPCFRREAGSYGRDVKGLMRVHQFTKVEQFVIGPAEGAASLAMLDRLLANAEEILQALEIPYRVVLVCTGDMGDGKVKMYDVESWVPSENRYRETHSDSFLGEWQARRVNLRYRGADGKVRFAHTLNNTALASPRIMIPLLENHQRPDGSVRIPAALRPYLRMDAISPSD